MTKKVFVALFIVVICFSSCEREKPTETAVENQPEPVVVQNDLPFMQISLLDGSNIQTKELTGKTVLVLFQPDCEDCQKEAVEIRKNLVAFESYQMYFISSYPVDIIQKFAIDYKLLDAKNVHFGNTTVENVLNNFGAIHAPSVYVYNEQGKLTASFSGQTSIDAIVKEL
jgi:peroxiredoxin